ncbi:MAG: transcriptional repressor [Saprospiraceae bacterium]
MTNNIQRIKDRLSTHKLRSTPVRKAVLSAFYNAAGTALASRDIEENLIYLDRITLYRTLKSFEQKGIIHTVIDGTGVNKYALCRHHQCDHEGHHDVHAHFFCVTCEQTTCLEDTKVSQPSLTEGFEIISAQLVLSGICNRCSQSQS